MGVQLRDAMIGAAHTAVDVFYRSQHEGREDGLMGFARELENAVEGEDHMESEM